MGLSASATSPGIAGCTRAGKAEGAADAVLAILDGRDVTVPDGVGSRIACCADLDQFDVWIRRAATAETIEDVLR